MTTQESDETAGQADLGNQYGDYNGLAVFKGLAHPVWTDRRAAAGKEQVYTATIGGAAPNPRPTNTTSSTPKAKNKKK